MKSEEIKTYCEITSKYMNSSFKWDKDEEFWTFLCEQGFIKCSPNSTVPETVLFTNKKISPKRKDQYLGGPLTDLKYLLLTLTPRVRSIKVV